MDFFSKSIDFTLNYFNSDKRLGLTDKQLNKNLSKYGKNLLSKKKKTPFISKLFSCFLEPMILILIFGFLIAFGTCLGKFFKTNEFDFNECGGILAAIFLSVSITLIMEGNSEKAFEKLNKIYDNLTVKVIRNGQTLVLPRHSIAVGDLVIVESGDKVVADGRLIKSNGLSVDESALTGESVTTNKSADVILKENTPESVEKAFRAVREWVDKHPEQAPLVVVNSWNEWTEGSYFEPDTINGYGFLDAARKAFVDEE